MIISSKRLKQIIKEELDSALTDQEQSFDQATPEQMLNQLLKGIEQYSSDPEIIAALGEEGFDKALELIRTKIVGGDQPEGGEEEGLAGIMEKKNKLFRYEQIMLQEQIRIDKLHDQMQQEILSEDWQKELPHIGLDVLGLIPGFGEAADLTNAALYAKKGEHLMAALSVISMIPAIGDAIGKGGKVGVYLSKFGAKGGTKAGSYLGKMFSKQMPKITKTLNSLKSNKLIGPYVDDMLRAVTKYVDDAAAGVADKILPQVQKAVGVAPTQTVSKDKYVAIAQKAQGKTAARQNRQKIAQNLSGDGEEELQKVAERSLTKAEYKKKKEIADAIEDDDPDMPDSKRYAIATAAAKKSAN